MDDKLADGFIHHVDMLYRDYDNRCNLKKWQALFEEYFLTDSTLTTDDLELDLFDYLKEHTILPPKIGQYIVNNFRWHDEEVHWIWEIYDYQYIKDTLRSITQKHIFDKFDYTRPDEPIPAGDFMDYRLKGADALRYHHMEVSKDNLLKAYAIYPRDYWLLRYLCEYCRDVNDIDGGLKYSEELVQYFGLCQISAKHRAYFYFKKKFYEKVLKDCEVGLDLEKKENSDELLMLGCRSLIELGKYNEAQSYLDTLFRIYPHDIQGQLIQSQLWAKHKSYLESQDMTKEEKNTYKRVRKGLKRSTNMSNLQVKLRVYGILGSIPLILALILFLIFK